MKKRIVWCVLIVCVVISLSYYISLPDYCIVNGMSYSSDEVRDTELRIVVYQYWDLDGLVNSIVEEHNKINGIPNTLKMELYYSRFHLRSGLEPFKIIVMKYE